MQKCRTTWLYHGSALGPEKGIGKTSGGSDEVEIRLIRLGEGKRIEQNVAFENEDSALADLRRVVWTFQHFRAEAEAMYTESWRTVVREKYGAEPFVTYFDSPVVVDNVSHEILSDE